MNKRIPRTFEKDADKVFCRVRKIKDTKAIARLRRNFRLYQLCGAYLITTSHRLPVLKDMVKNGSLFIWTGNKSNAN